MKMLYFLLFVSIMKLSAQSSEFATSKNGLIYSDEAVKELKHIVDSLNLKFKVCETKAFYSTLQGKALYFKLSGNNANRALEDIKRGMVPADLKKKYPKGELSDEMLVVRHSYDNYEGDPEMAFESLDLADEGPSMSFSGGKLSTAKAIKIGWIYDFHKKSEWSEETVEGFYFEKELSSKPMPDKYSRLVQYSECLVDTTAQVFFKEAQEEGWRYRAEGADGLSKVKKFLDYADKVSKKPQYDQNEDEDFDDEKYEAYSKKMDRWEKKRLSITDSLMKHDANFKRFFTEALDEALSKKKATGEEFEEYVGRYDSKENELQLKRSRIVVGGCSQDQSPRFHALAIAELAAETAKWEIFLRSHLDIMNDRFQRASDGSYAWGQRKTYIKELEVLDINVNDLLLGISLRIENPSENHYFGSISRIGRSLAEAKDSAAIENEMLAMMADNSLDDYNRVLVYWLYRNYNRNIENEKLRETNDSKLKDVVAVMPAYLSKTAKFKE